MRDGGIGIHGLDGDTGDEKDIRRGGRGGRGGWVVLGCGGRGRPVGEWVDGEELVYLANKLFDMTDTTEFLDCSLSYNKMFGRPSDPKRPWSRVLNLSPSSNWVVRFCEDAEDIRPLCGMELLQFLGLDPAYFPEECEEMSSSWPNFSPKNKLLNMSAAQGMSGPPRADPKPRN